MIQKSFVLLEGVRSRTEHQIWQQGIHSWASFSQTKKITGISPARKSHYDRQLAIARSRLYAMDSSYFTDVLPAGETWRLYDFFHDDCVFLDIETTGYYGDITVIGVYDGNETKTLVKGINLDHGTFARAIEGAKMLVTFNGRSFDVPVINRYFHGSIPSVPHLDLRFALKKLGYDGGLKKIEQSLGIRRRKEVEGMTGEDAVLLWNLYKESGNPGYLDRIVQYNEEDIVNLKPIADFAYRELSKQMQERMRVQNAQ
ncbi:ribonuclease H-like domain-containing protein [Candidatus Woesearchaeota archaeon]|nr:ribonuclease H-like domain-containing protein [Candidatus Woesearchaeota archaeon]